jgi:hypothetical protein
MVTATAMFLLAAISFNSLTAYSQGGANMTGMMATLSKLPRQTSLVFRGSGSAVLKQHYV